MNQELSKSSLHCLTPPPLHPSGLCCFSRAITTRLTRIFALWITVKSERRTPDRLAPKTRHRPDPYCCGSVLFWPRDIITYEPKAFQIKNLKFAVQIDSPRND